MSVALLIEPLKAQVFKLTNQRNLKTSLISGIYSRRRRKYIHVGLYVAFMPHTLGSANT